MRIAGRWRITEAELWDCGALNLVAPAFIEFAEDGSSGSFGFIAVQGEMDCREVERGGRPGMEFSWEGNDEGDPTRAASGCPSRRETRRMLIRVRAAPGDRHAAPGSAAGAGLGDQSELAGLGDGLGAVGRPQLAQDVADVLFDGVEGDHQLPGDARVRRAGGQQRQHLQFAGG